MKRDSSRRVSKPEKSMAARSARAAPPSGEFVAGGVEQPGAESLQHARAAVGVGAAADAQDDLAAAGVERRADQLAGAEAAGSPGRSGTRPPAVVPGEDGEAGSRGHFDHGLTAADRELRCQRLPGGAADHGPAAGEAGADGGVEGALAAVGHGNPQYLKGAQYLQGAGAGRCGGALPEPFFKVPGDVRGGE
jgi:hypothetical protein